MVIKRYRIGIITSTRADFGILKPLIFALKKQKNIDLQLIATGTHLSEIYGHTISDIEDSGLRVDCKIDIFLSDDSQLGIINSTARTISVFGSHFKDNKYDCIILLGDRFEIFGVAVAAALSHIPIVHLHGGETTEGALDEYFRHCITKMSCLHFPCHELYKKRIIQLGENPDTVFNVGSLGVENALNILNKSNNDKKINKILDDTFFSEFALVIFHPETIKNSSVKTQVYSIISALKNHSEYNYLIIESNADSGGKEINEIWNKESCNNSNWRVVSSISSEQYLLLLSKAKFILGNSSSGIIEAPTFRTPTINIGDRQKGRITASSVINCKIDTDEISESILKIREGRFIFEYNCPFGDGKTSKRIIEILLKSLEKGFDNQKSFYDIDFEV